MDMQIFNDILNMQLSQRKDCDKLGFNYLYPGDMAVCDYVSSILPYVDIKGVYTGSDISLDTLKEETLSEMTLFGEDIVTKVNDLISTVPIEISSNDDDFQFATGVSYASSEFEKIIPNSGKISKYVIPKKISEFSVFNFGHEQIHALKETNYDEYQDNIRFGEVIPIFYELIACSNNQILKNELIKFRMFYLSNDRIDYVYFDELYTNTSMFDFFMSHSGDFIIRKGLYDFIRCKRGSYLNSFYYALILYNMYKETPLKILNLVSSVLKHEMTTLQMLEYLGIYGDIRGEVFEKELGQIRKVLK